MSVAVVLIDGLAPEDPVDVDLLVDNTYFVLFGTPAWKASLEWARFHNIDPHRVVAGSTIVRSAHLRRILVDEYADLDDHGRMAVEVGPDGPHVITRQHVEQGEAPPLPLPPEVLALNTIRRWDR